MKISQETPRRSIKTRLNKPTIELLERGKLQMLSLNRDLDGRFVNVENPILKCPSKEKRRIDENSTFFSFSSTDFNSRNESTI